MPTTGSPARGQLPEVPPTPVGEVARAPPLLPLLGAGSPGLGLCPVAPMPVDPTLREWCSLGTSGRKANSDPERLLVPEKTACQQGGVWLVSWGRTLASVSAHSRTNESSSTWGSLWPLSSHMRRAGTTEASIAHPPRPPAPLHGRCSLVDVNLPHPHTGPVIQSRSSSPDIVPTLPGS